MKRAPITPAVRRRRAVRKERWHARAFRRLLLENLEDRRLLANRVLLDFTPDKIAGEYAVERLRQHAENFNELYNEIKESAIDEQYLKGIEEKFNLFPDIDYSVYGT